MKHHLIAAVHRSFVVLLCCRRPVAMAVCAFLFFPALPQAQEAADQRALSSTAAPAWGAAPALAALARAVNASTRQPEEQQSEQPHSASSSAEPSSGSLLFVLIVNVKEPINGLNAHCFSNVITIPDFDWSDWHAPGRANELIEPYKDEFLRKCRGRAELHGTHVQIVVNSPGNENAPAERVVRYRGWGFPQVTM